jgi:glutathione S-transferase
MPTRIYAMGPSHPARAGIAMLRHKRIPHRVVWLMPGLHPMLVRVAGFERHTVPALDIDGQKVQDSSDIARYLDVVAPDPPLFPADPSARASVEQAEQWGQRVLQPVPRRLFRYLMVTSRAARIWMGGDVMGVPAAGLLQAAFLPGLRRLAQISHADEATVRETLRRLPELLDHVDALLAEGTIGGAQPNAADFQILSGVRVLLEFEDLAHLVEGRPCADSARSLFPTWIGPIPRGLPVS